MYMNTVHDREMRKSFMLYYWQPIPVALNAAGAEH